VAHRGVSGGVAVGRRGGSVVVRKLSGGAFRRGRRDGRSSVRGEKLRGSSGAFIGVGGAGGVGGVTAAVNGD
jgi:hypothetical protein